MTAVEGTVSGIRWTEPTEGLEFGESFLGGVASINLGRGRSSGYAVYFTDRRVIGVWMRMIARVLLIPYLIVIGSLYVLLIVKLGSQDTFLLLLPLILIVADQAFRILTRHVAERAISRRRADVSRAVKGRKDFEVRRSDIAGFLMKYPPRGVNLGTNSGFLRITSKDHQAPMIEIKIRGWTQGLSLRDLVISFANREPRIAVTDYPYN